MDKFECQVCGSRFGTEESLNQHTKAKHGASGDKKSKGAGSIRRYFIKKYFIAAGMILALALFSYALYARSQRPGQYDDFAKCLTEKEVVVYGNDFCQYTTKQLGYFGKSKQHIKYVKCTDNKEICDSKRVQITPTWEINGQTYSGVQSFEMLARLSGCKL